jgi:hypothetical protein
MSFQDEIADTSERFTLADLVALEALDKAACDAMESWLYDPMNETKIEANRLALQARAAGLADNGTALLKLARAQLSQ